MLYLPAPDKSRYIFFKKPERTMRFSANYKANFPSSITPEQEKALAAALAKEHFLYMEEHIRKFWDDMNSMAI